MEVHHEPAIAPVSRPQSGRRLGLFLILSLLWLAAAATLVSAVLRTPAGPRAMGFMAGERSDPLATCGGPELLIGDILWTICEAFENGQYWLTRADFSTATATLVVQLPSRPDLLIESAAGDLGLLMDRVVYELRAGSAELTRHRRGRFIQDLAFRGRTLWALDGTAGLTLRSGDREERLMTLQPAPGRTLLPMPGRLRLWNVAGQWRVITVDALARPGHPQGSPGAKAVNAVNAVNAMNAVNAVNAVNAANANERHIVWTDDGRTIHKIAELSGDQQPVLLTGAVDRHVRAGLLLQYMDGHWRTLKPPLQAQLRYHAIRRRRINKNDDRGDGNGDAKASGAVDWLLTSYRAGGERNAKRLGRVADRWLYLGADGRAGAVGWTQDTVTVQMSAAVELRVLPHGDGYLLVDGMRLAFVRLDKNLQRVDAPSLGARLVSVMRSAGRLTPHAAPLWWVQFALVVGLLTTVGLVGQVLTRRLRKQP